MVFECFMPGDGLLGCCFQGGPGWYFWAIWGPHNKIIDNYMPKGSYAKRPPWGSLLGRRWLGCGGRADPLSAKKVS